MGPSSFVSLGKRDRDDILADWDKGPRVQPAYPTDRVSFWVSGRERSRKPWVEWHPVLHRAFNLTFAREWQ